MSIEAITTIATADVLEDIAIERLAQDAKWGEQNHPSFWEPRDIIQREERRDYLRRRCDERHNNGQSYGSWEDVLDEEIAETYAEVEPAKIRAELVQSAAVIVAWIECIDRQSKSVAS